MMMSTESKQHFVVLHQFNLVLINLNRSEISPWTGRFYSLLDPSYAKNNIPIIASVSEHQPTTWSSFYFDLQILVFLFPGWLVLNFFSPGWLVIKFSIGCRYVHRPCLLCSDIVASIQHPRSAVSCSSCLEHATYWCMCKCCVTYLLFIIIIYF